MAKNNDDLQYGSLVQQLQVKQKSKTQTRFLLDSVAIIEVVVCKMCAELSMPSISVSEHSQLRPAYYKSDSQGYS